MKLILCLNPKTNKFGYVDFRHRWIIKPRFDDAENFVKGKAKVKIGERTFFIDETGSELK